MVVAIISLIAGLAFSFTIFKMGREYIYSPEPEKVEERKEKANEDE